MPRGKFSQKVKLFLNGYPDKVGDSLLYIIDRSQSYATISFQAHCAKTRALLSRQVNEEQIIGHRAVQCATAGPAFEALFAKVLAESRRSEDFGELIVNWATQGKRIN